MTLIFSSCMNSSSNHSRHRLEQYFMCQSGIYFFVLFFIQPMISMIRKWPVASLPRKLRWKCWKLCWIKSLQHRTESILSHKWQNAKNLYKNSFIQPEPIFISIFESFDFFWVHRCQAPIRPYCRMWKVFNLAWNHKIKK